MHMTIIDDILAHKQKEVTGMPDFLERNLEKNERSFFDVLKRKSGEAVNVIAEVKQASPSEGMIQAVDCGGRAKIYEHFGAAAISCLTDEKYFSGSCDDLEQVVEAVDLPVIRKDFIFTKNQIAQARFFGASSFLLMVEVMEKTDMDLEALIEYGRELGMEPLVETYDAQSIEKAAQAGAKIIGVNSRNFQKEGLPIEFERFEQLLPLIPDGIVRVAESGMKTVEDIMQVEHLVDAVLVGTALMRRDDAGVQQFFSDTRKHCKMKKYIS